MTKILLKKQLMEVFSWVYRNRKTGKNRTGTGAVLFALLYVLLFGFVGVMFYFVADTLCGPLTGAGLGWMYFALMGLMGVFFGVFGSVFSTYATLYQAKDNDFLLSLPITPSRVLLTRLFGVWTIGTMYELIVMIPAVIAWIRQGGANGWGILFSLLIPLILSILVTALSAILGWVVAIISGHLKNKTLKNMLVVALSLAFIAAYYYFYANAYSLLESILADPRSVSGGVRTALYPLYHMGLAAEGKALSMLIFTVIVGAAAGLVYLALSRSFLRLNTAGRGTAQAKRRVKREKTRTVGRTLLRRELLRFLGSTNYMLNCGLGAVLMPAAAVVLLIKGGALSAALEGVFAGYEGMLPLLGAAAICMLASMNDTTAPSVSLEGKTIYLMQSLPVSGKQALMAKLKLHLLLTMIPAALLTLSVEWVIKPTLGFALLIPLSAAVFILFLGAFGLALNLKMPNLGWTSEVVPIKQSMPVMIALFGGWVLVMVLAVGCWLLWGAVPPEVCLLLCCVLVLLAALALLRWIFTKGAEIFEDL